MDALHGLLAASAERYPDKAAYVGRDTRRSYAELYGDALAFSSTLRELGARRGDRVAIVLDGTPDYLVAFYGALLAGACAVPLCPDTRTGSLVRALSHSGARIVVLDASNLRWLDGQAARTPELQAIITRGDGHLSEPGHLRQLALADALKAPRAEERERGAHDDDLAALVYTSGTTGDPKGVMLSHTNLVSNVRSIIEYLELTERDTVGMVLPFYYVYGNSVLHTHLAAGATIAQLGSMAFLAQVVEGLSSHRCTGLSGVPTTFARLTSFASLGKHDLSALRYVTQAGAAMPPRQIEAVERAFPQARVFVMYGQTEASARLAYLPPARLREKLGSAGKAIPGVTLKICGKDGDELPRGKVGEVVAEGPNVMLGYFRDPEATDRVLRPEGLRTGDLGFMDEEGFVFLEGRESELIKSGGHRISPLEIEHAVGTAPGVREVGVCGVPDDALGEAIAAFLVLDPGASVAKRRLLDACSASLPRFKMPAHLLVVDALPRGATGKLLRRELRGWFVEGRGTPVA